MKVYETAGLRNLALIGHGGCGKTQLVSALLFASGAVPRLGRVDDGSAVTDFDDEEIARQHSLSAALAYCEWQKTKLNLVDTPGFANFLTDARAALRVVEAAVVVVDGVAGVEVQTEKFWAEAADLGLPRLVALSRMDRDRASFERALQSLHERCAREIVPVQIPVGEERGFSGVVDLVRMKALTSTSGSTAEADVPAPLLEAAQRAREQLIEMVAEANDELLDAFFTEGTLTQAQLESGLQAATKAGRLFPLFCTSGIGMVGVTPLLDAAVALVPSPAERLCGALAPQTPPAPPAADDAPLAAVVWKTVADAFAGRITLLRVLSGVLRSDTTVLNVTRDTPERLGHLLVLQGKAQTHVTELHAGDLGAVAKLKVTHTLDVLAEKAAHAPALRPFDIPQPVLAYAIEPKSRADEDKISTAMHRLEEEDQTIHYARDPQTHELLLSGQGQLHIEVTVAKLKRRFGVEVNLKPPHVPYRETITVATEAHGRHKKQTGGHGQFGDCKIRVEPLPRGSDFTFEDDIFGGSIPRQFVPAVEKGIQDARMRGYLAGYPMVDFKATVFDGSYHAVDSNELSFKMAGSLAFKDAMTRARPTLLEPVMRVEVYAPSDHAGDLMGDLNGRRGRIAGMDTRGQLTVIRAQVPMAEMLTYEQHLTSATGGRGSYHMEYSHYEEVPSHLQPRIVAAAKAERGVHAAVEEEA